MSSTGVISWGCLRCRQSASRNWDCSFVPYGLCEQMVASAARVLLNKRRVHISTLCENCSTGLSEEKQVWEVQHTISESKKIMNSGEVKLHIFLTAATSH
ncbi:uncharacterized protein BDW43DRAFT_266874, partial [Aspergillus alliaceus]|uniref:uncharacterized protein n=1 Tax=Petromyces alliaceus TaxID=209559 RepID=UPI0012A4FE8A